MLSPSQESVALELERRAQAMDERVYLRKESKLNPYIRKIGAKADGGPSATAISYLEKTLSDVDALAGSEKDLEYAHHCHSLLKEPSNSCEKLSKMLAGIENDSEVESNVRVDALKMFAELCLVLQNAAENSEDHKDLTQSYMDLFNKADRLKNETEFLKAKVLGFEGTFEEYLETVNSNY